MWYLLLISIFHNSSWEKYLNLTIVRLQCTMYTARLVTWYNRLYKYLFMRYFVDSFPTTQVLFTPHMFTFFTAEKSDFFIINDITISCIYYKSVDHIIRDRLTYLIENKQIILKFPSPTQFPIESYNQTLINLIIKV